MAEHQYSAWKCTQCIEELSIFTLASSLEFFIARYLNMDSAVEELENVCQCFRDILSWEGISKQTTFLEKHGYQYSPKNEHLARIEQVFRKIDIKGDRIKDFEKISACAKKNL